MYSNEKNSSPDRVEKNSNPSLSGKKKEELGVRIVVRSVPKRGDRCVFPFGGRYGEVKKALTDKCREREREREIWG